MVTVGAEPSTLDPGLQNHCGGPWAFEVQGEEAVRVIAQEGTRGEFIIGSGKVVSGRFTHECISLSIDAEEPVAAPFEATYRWVKFASGTRASPTGLPPILPFSRTTTEWRFTILRAVDGSGPRTPPGQHWTGFELEAENISAGQSSLLLADLLMVTKQGFQARLIDESVPRVTVLPGARTRFEVVFELSDGDQASLLVIDPNPFTTDDATFDVSLLAYE